MSKGFKDVLTFISHYSSATVKCFTSLAQAVASQAKTMETLKRVFIVIMPEYLFEFNSFRKNLVNLIQLEITVI